MMTSIHTDSVTANTLGDTLFDHTTALKPVTYSDALAVKHPYLLAVPRWRGAMVLLWCSLLLMMVYLQHASLQVRSYIDVVAWGSIAFDNYTGADASHLRLRRDMASDGHRSSGVSLPPEKHALLRQLAKQSHANMQEHLLVAHHVVIADSAR